MSSKDEVTKEELLVKQQKIEKQLERLETMLSEKQAKEDFKRDEAAAFAEFKTQEALRQLKAETEGEEPAAIDIVFDIQFLRNNKGTYLYGSGAEFEDTGIHFTKDNTIKGYVHLNWDKMEELEGDIGREKVVELKKLNAEDIRSIGISLREKSALLINEKDLEGQPHLTITRYSDNPEQDKLGGEPILRSFGITVSFDMDRVFREIRPCSYYREAKLNLEMKDGSSINLPLEYVHLEKFFRQSTAPSFCGALCRGGAHAA